MQRFNSIERNCLGAMSSRAIDHLNLLRIEALPASKRTNAALKLTVANLHAS